MQLNEEIIREISQKYGDSFYILDSKKFINNYLELQNAFRKIYKKSFIAYSYKTNYIPRLCNVVNSLGGFAEIVSDMEYEIALRIGVKPENIMFNGPYKQSSVECNILLNGGNVNVDSLDELAAIKAFAATHIEKNIGVGLRCNFDIGDGVVSRFGFDVEGKEFIEALNILDKTPNLYLKGIHSHFASRRLDTWPARAKGILKLVQMYLKDPLEYISLGGGLFGNMDDSLKAQFEVDIPNYNDYAESVMYDFQKYFRAFPENLQPKIFIEPGTALVGDAMQFIAKVISIKDVRNKKIATLLGSIYNINPTLNKKNPPIQVFNSASVQSQFYDNLDFGGYTCIESDYLYKGYSGNLAVGGYVAFSNVGSYSIVLKPPFILPNFPIVEYSDNQDEMRLVKRAETFDDLFHTFAFDK